MVYLGRRRLTATKTTLDFIHRFTLVNFLAYKD